MHMEYKNSKAIHFLQDTYIPKNIQHVDFLYEQEKQNIIQQLQSESIFKLYSMIFDIYSNAVDNDLDVAYANVFEFFYQMICNESYERADLLTSIFIQRIDPIFHIYSPVTSASQIPRTYSE